MSRTDSSGQDGLRGPLTIACPACKKPAGEKCHTVIDGVDVGWTHDARYEAHGGFRMAPWPDEDPDDAEATNEGRDVLADAIRLAVKVGHIGPNSAEIIGRGGRVALTYSEAEEAADALLPVIAALTANAKAEVDDLRARLAKVEALCRTVIEVHAQVVMDTPKDRELHDRAIATFRAAALRSSALANPDAEREGGA